MMSTNKKFPSNSSTPVKVKATNSTTDFTSPSKSSKYRNFLASVLTPSQSKKWIKRKKSNKSEKSSKTETEIEDIYKSRLSDDFSEPAYSSIQELQLKQPNQEESIIDSSSYLSTKYAEVHESSNQHLNLKSSEQFLTSSVSGEPLYASVNKEKKLKNKNIVAKEHFDSSYVEEPNEKSISEYVSGKLAKNRSEDSLEENVIEEQKEEIRLLVERLKELTTENRELHRNIETVIREEKWKEESLHAELKLKISQLEADTYKEVKCLSDQLQTLHKERKVLTDQIHILHEEKKLMQIQHEDICSKAKAMVSPDFLKKTVEEHQRLLNEMKKRHEDEIKKLKKENETLLESKISLSGENEDLKGKIKTFLMKTESLKNSEQELMQEKNRILLQLDESKQMQQESQNMLLALLKITESVVVERDVLLNKASYQDHQQKLLKNSIMDYTLNMGRLQEHISNLGREKLEELQKLKTGELLRDENLKSFYGKHLDILHSKVLNQNNTINDLESEKSKLELQLESLWQAACVGKPKILEDPKYNV